MKTKIIQQTGQVAFIKIPTAYLMFIGLCIILIAEE